MGVWIGIFALFLALPVALGSFKMTTSNALQYLDLCTYNKLDNVATVHIKWLERVLKEEEKLPKFKRIATWKIGRVVENLRMCSMEEEKYEKCVIKQVNMILASLAYCYGVENNQFQAIKASDPFISDPTAIYLSEQNYINGLKSITVLDLIDSFKVESVTGIEKDSNNATIMLKKFFKIYNDDLKPDVSFWFLINDFAFGRTRPVQRLGSLHFKKTKFIELILKRRITLTGRTDVSEIWRQYEDNLNDPSGWSNRWLSYQFNVLPSQSDTFYENINSLDKRYRVTVWDRIVYSLILDQKRSKAKRFLKRNLPAEFEGLFEYDFLDPSGLNELIHKQLSLRSVHEMYFYLFTGKVLKNVDQFFNALLSIPLTRHRELIGHVKRLMGAKLLNEKYLHLQSRFPYMSVLDLFNPKKDNSKKKDVIQLIHFMDFHEDDESFEFDEKLALKFAINENTRKAINSLPKRGKLDWAIQASNVRLMVSSDKCWDEIIFEHFDQFIQNYLISIVKVSRYDSGYDSITMGEYLGVVNFEGEYTRLLLTERLWKYLPITPYKNCNAKNLAIKYLEYNKQLYIILEESPGILEIEHQNKKIGDLYEVITRILVESAVCNDPSLNEVQIKEFLIKRLTTETMKRQTKTNSDFFRYDVESLAKGLFYVEAWDLELASQTNPSMWPVIVPFLNFLSFSNPTNINVLPDEFKRAFIKINLLDRELCFGKNAIAGAIRKWLQTYYQEDVINCPSVDSTLGGIFENAISSIDPAVAISLQIPRLSKGKLEKVIHKALVDSNQLSITFVFHLLEAHFEEGLFNWTLYTKFMTRERLHLVDHGLQINWERNLMERLRPYRIVDEVDFFKTFRDWSILYKPKN